MKNVLRISALLTVALMVFIMIGCGSSDDTKTVTPPTLKSSSPAAGGEVAANATITLTFDKSMKDVTVNGTAATVSGATATWKPAAALPTGPVTLTIDGNSADGGKLATATLALTVKAADTTAPDIDGAKSVPANGATGLDPATISDITIVFTEPMSADTKVDSYAPSDAKFNPAMAADGLSMKISFLGGYKLGNEVTVDVKLIGADLAGNPLKTTDYTFTTMKKAE